MRSIHVPVHQLQRTQVPDMLYAAACKSVTGCAGQQHRKMLQWGNNRNRNSNLNANTLRAQASTSQVSAPP